MNKETDDILNKYVNLINKGYCSDCNELNCLGNFPHRKIAREIISLQNRYDFALEDVAKLQKKAEQGEHYKHLYSLVKKQKDDVADYVNFLEIDTPEGFIPFNKTIWGEEILELLGEIDE